VFTPQVDVRARRPAVSQSLGTPPRPLAGDRRPAESTGSSRPWISARSSPHTSVRSTCWSGSTQFAWTGALLRSITVLLAVGFLAALDLPEIGEALAVAMLLEGSVQRARGRVGIIAQLADARTDRQLWAER
jgi:hypothetical protein